MSHTSYSNKDSTMTIQFTVTQNGKPLAKSKYKWDEETRTFSTKQNNLVIDFGNEYGITFTTGDLCNFKTGDNCTFKTGDWCTFNTAFDCTFKTGYECTFKTGDCCTFNTASDCTFNTGDNCTFNTASDCTLNTGDHCTFKTGCDCTFTTGSDCTFKTDHNCTFTTGENCVVIRYDVKGVTEIPQNKTIKLNEYGIQGYTEVEPEPAKEYTMEELVNLVGHNFKIKKQD